MSADVLVPAALGAVLAALVGLAAWTGVTLQRFRAYHRYKGEEPPPMPLGALLRYVVGETWAMLTIGWWTVAAGRDRLIRPRGPETGPPVLCVHGFSQDGSNLWGIRRALARRGRASRAVSIGRYRPSLNDHVPPLVKALRELIAGTAGPVDVVAHSMGGVVLRLALATHPELAPNIRRVVTLGSPHRGTAAGRGLPLGRTVRALGRRSDVLRELPGFPPTAALTTISARNDLVVYPQATCHLDGARTVDLPDIGHVGLLTRPAVHALVVEALCAEEDPGAER